ncbi:ABC transporter ATP-binding protein [Phytohabitans aurantiacus]|uniref:ABC transporter n=1 Tax=Phytohabitans aurantiacus TaxID=3016789 RepID=A0ABQ5QSM5_9ACTN|nr:ABC transporter ATP-binding protein [Phytohabitans aurantiacus]GLH96886.1 ABC transporter [Phytohabitans aurantiacus]
MRYMWWLVRSQPVRVLRGSLIGTVWMIGLAVRPYLISRAIDDGLRAHDRRALALWVGAIAVAGFVLAYLGIMRHRTMTFVREDATARSAGVLVRHVSRVGAVLPRRLAAGEAATVGGADIGNVSAVLTVTGPGVGAVIAYGVVAVLLWSASPFLALFVLLGVPVMTLIAGPLLRRLESAEHVYRHQQGALTARASDIVAGLRVLAGVGGRGLFARRFSTQSQDLLAQGYRVGAARSWIDALTVVIPGIFLATVVWLAARTAASGDITIGEMVAVYGYVSVLIVPVWFLLEAAYQMIRGRVAARRIIAVLSVIPDGTGGRGDQPGPERPADLYDPDTGLVVPDGLLVGVAVDEPAEAVALGDRLGRFAPGEATWGGIPLAKMALDEVRARILVADHDSYLFAGTVRETLRIRESASDAEIWTALRAASAEDVVDALPDGLSTHLVARARTISGGQRQRIRLARALLAEPDVLILIDPTSAVDAHTEARVARRLRSARAGRTTVLVSTSPLLLGEADLVAHVRDGRVVATGRHAELLDDDPSYRALVARDADIDDDAAERGGVRR